MSQIPLIHALNALSRLTKVTDVNGNYLHMQTSFSEHTRAYICLCPMLKDHVVIHEEYDGDNKLNNTQVMAKKFVKSYLESHDNIIFVGLREEANDEDQMTVMYKA